MVGEEFEQLRQRFRHFVRGARWSCAKTPSGDPLLVGRLRGTGHRILVWPQAEGRFRIGLDALRVRGSHASPQEALGALQTSLAADRRPRYIRARVAYQRAQEERWRNGPSSR